jgi:hypothetical protein
VIVPVAPLVPPDSVEEIALAVMAVPDTSVFGPEAVSAVVFLTTVEVIPVPQVLFDVALLESPL